LALALGIRTASDQRELPTWTDAWEQRRDKVDRRDEASIPPSVDSPSVYPIVQLMHALLEEVPQTTRDMVLVSSLPERFGHALCAHLTQNSFSRATRLLTEVIRHNFFIQADEEPGWYRYHDLIRECLNHLCVERFGRAQVSEFLRRAANWFHGANELPQAIDHALMALDPGLAATYMAELSPSYIWDKGIFRTFERWVTALYPASQADHPSFLILLGRARLDIGDRTGERRWLNQAMHLAQAPQAQTLIWE
jgi:ATP/maltotriose-dependent transcriptional regulator MalT